MTVKELIEALSQYPEDAEVISIEADDWQWKICTNEWRLRHEYLDNTKMIILNPE